MATLLLLVAAGIAIALYVQRALPVIDGRQEIGDLHGALRIERDADGVPTVRAQHDDDVWFGLGYAHAQDRLWQLELHRRVVAGRLAEAFGPAALDTDRFLRVLGVRRAAAAQWERLDGEARRVLQRYADGINAYLDHGLRARPPEFLALGLQPERWDPVDTLGWTLMMAWDLGANWSLEMTRLRLALKLPIERLDDVLPPYPGDGPSGLDDYARQLRDWQLASEPPVSGLLQRLAEAEAAAPPTGLDGLGSNNWVVSGARSTSGAPLLANDPHLRLSAPALWYLARLEAPGVHVAGATIPGLPIVVLGQNQRIAWGFTNTATDVQDLYLERLHPDDPGQYQTPDGWARFEQSTETIRVRGAADVTVLVRRSRHGPLISDAGAADGALGAAAPTPPGAASASGASGASDASGASGASGAPASTPRYAMALRWLALDPDPGALVAGLAFNRARSVDEFVAAASDYVAPMQNMVVADVEGHIGFVAAGRVPKRRPDNAWRGLVPSPGWDARYDWDGWVAPGDTPRERDPSRGWLATANQRIQRPDDPVYLTRDWTPPYRQQRIETLLAATPRHDVASFLAMQADEHAEAALRLWPWLLRSPPSHPLAAALRPVLEGFDGRMRGDSAAALVYWAWQRQLSEALFRPRLGDALFARLLAGRGLREALERVLLRDDPWWCDDPATPQSEHCQDRSDAALGRALDELRAAQGDDVTHWRWDRAHAATAEHRPFSRVPVLAPLFEIDEPVGGDTTTVSALRVSMQPGAAGDGRYPSEHGPSYRAVYDLADARRSRVMQSSGQSGLVFSRLYRRFAGGWARHETRPLWSEDAPASVLRLEPPRAP